MTAEHGFALTDEVIPLSVVIAIRDADANFADVLRSVIPQCRMTGAEVIVVGPKGLACPDGVRVVEVDDTDLNHRRLIGVRHALGAVVAVGEDHAVPRADWCEAVIRGHTENPAALAVAGCLSNSSNRTLSGRVNFLAFAGPFQAPMSEPYPLRPPPLSCMSFKREVLDGLDEAGRLEAEILPSLWSSNRVKVDDRIVIDHVQDHGLCWAAANSFHSARSSYGLTLGDVRRTWRERAEQMGWALVNVPRRAVGDLRDRSGVFRCSRIELALVGLLGLAAGVGAAAGVAAGVGSSPRRVA